MTSENEECMVCTVINRQLYRERTEHGVIYEPGNQMVPGHLIFAPLVHVADAKINPTITAQVMRMVAMRATSPCTITIKVGEAAGQRQPHMYVEVFPAPAVRVDATPRKEENKDEPAIKGRAAGRNSRAASRRGDVPGSAERDGGSW